MPAPRPVAPPPPAEAAAAPRTAIVACPACGADAHVALHAAVDRWFGRPGRFTWARCADCGLTYLRTRPAADALADFYPPTYVAPGRAPAWLKRALDRLDLGARVKLVGALAGPRGRVLDVGCARGDFLALAREAGLRAEGLEPSAHLASAAAARGLDVRCAALGEAALAPEGYDVVTLWDVVEHLATPVEDLRRLARAVRPGGHLVASTPVLDGWEARAMGTRWPGWDTPRHLVVFSRATLGAVLAGAGFRVVAWRHTSESWLIAAMALSQAARAALPAPLATALHRALHARPVRLAARPVFGLLDRWPGGGWITVVARRDDGGAAPAPPPASR